jgi:DivIVA domain-containing protein
MELTLKRLLENAEFKKYRGKGYDPTEVDDFLDRAAAMASKVEVQLTQALEQARGAKAARDGAGRAEPRRDRGRDRASRGRACRRAAAQEPAGPSVDEIAEESRRMLALAQRTADAR